MKLKCPDCGTQYESGKFCQECGSKLQEIVPELVCPSCGFKAKSGKFCPECGTKLSDDASATVTENCVEEPAVERKFNEKDERFAKYYDKKGFPRNIPKEERAIAIEELTPFVEQNIAEAKMLLGGILLRDNNNKDNVLRGVSLLKEAEETGDKLAYYLIGGAYFYGFEPLINLNHNEAEKRMLERYQEYDDGETAGILSNLYAFSPEKCDYQKALQYATIAIEDDVADGYNVLGTLYLNGWGVEKNEELALENYKMAAAYGDEGAMNQIGFIFMGSDTFEANPEQSFFWFNEAASKGDEVGLYNLGYCYKNGFGVETDAEKAAECFKKSAELGYIDAMYELAHYYQEILFDLNKSKTWYLKAAELGHAESQNELSVLYANDDTEPNFEEALKWCKKAMEQEYPWAFRNYAIWLWEGNVVKGNKDEALKMMQKSVDLGLSEAAQELEEMKASLTNTEEDSSKAYSETPSQMPLPNELHVPDGTNILFELDSSIDKSIIEYIFLPNSLTMMEEEILSQLPNLQKIIIPKGKLDKFGKMLPYSWWKMYYEDGTSVCPELSLSFPKGASVWIFPYGPTTLTTSDGRGAKDHVLISPTYINIEKKAFSYNNNVLSINMTDSVRFIGEKAFESCKNLVYLRLSNKIREIPKSMVEFCKSLREIVVPQGVTSIGAGAFSSCKSLSKVVLPSTILSIDRGGTFGVNPFQYSDGLKKIIIPKVRGSKVKFESLLKGFSGNPARLLVEECLQPKEVVEKPKTTKSLGNKSLPMDEIRRNANASYPKQSLKDLAKAVLKIAEVIEERLPNEEVSYMVHPSEFAPEVDPNALPIHFLFKKNGVPKVAVVAVTEYGYRTPRVIATQLACDFHDVAYIRVYADGTYSDWMQPGADSGTIEFCKNWLVKKITNNL